jgi:hypothetical protein
LAFHQLCDKNRGVCFGYFIVLLGRLFKMGQIVFRLFSAASGSFDSHWAASKPINPGWMPPKIACDRTGNQQFATQAQT